MTTIGRLGCQVTAMFFLLLARMAMAQDDAESRPAARPPRENKAELEKFASDAYKKSISPFLAANCVKCHGNKKAQAKLNLETLKPDFLSDDTFPMWQLVYERIRDEEMPPPSEPRSRRGPGDDGDAPGKGEGAAFGFASLSKAVSRAAAWRAEDEVDLRRREILSEDDALTRLLKRRRNAAVDVVQASRNILESGVGQGITAFTVHQEALRQLLTAELDLVAGTPREIDIYKQQVALSRTLESFIYERFRSGTDPAQTFFEAKYDRLDAEVKLQRAIAKFKASPARP